jgi:hypothetical protein
MKTIAISFHGTERIQVPDEQVEEFLEDFSFAYKALLKQFNIQHGDIDIDYVWDEEESNKVEKSNENEKDNKKEILAKELLSKFLNNEISQKGFDEELKKIYH